MSDTPKQEPFQVLQFPTVRLESAETEEYVGRHRGSYSLPRDLANYRYSARRAGAEERT